MDTKLYIIRDIDPFDINTSLGAVKEVFNQLTYSHIPVMKEQVFVGCVSETDAHCFDSEKTLADYSYALEPFFVREHTNWLDIIEAFANNSSNIMPVLDVHNTYLGYFELADIMSLFNNTPFLNENGGIIEVQKGSRDYSFSEICQIIESNNAKLLGIFVSKIDGEKTQTTIKIGHTGMNAIVQTFRRYGYEIISSHDEDKWSDNLKERSEYLDKYLNI
ncbi:CBS domain-containing protein [uncultured Planktosalinus sp.]|uniref:CBS domain-containing protein n=1 Tax=uncultured Planktosalinus sp. TaxID=1810935 RepID=UPI0030DD7D45